MSATAVPFRATSSRLSKRRPVAGGDFPAKIPIGFRSAECAGEPSPDLGDEQRDEAGLGWRRGVWPGRWRGPGRWSCS
jgi:hypothetical protein